MSRTQTFAITRAGSLEQNATTITQRAESFALNDAVRSGVNLIVTRQGGAMQSLVVTPNREGADKAAMILAQAVAGRLEYDAEVPDINAPVVGRLTYVTTDAIVHSTQAGVDPAETSRQLATVLGEGEWVGLSSRPPTKAETKAHSRWLSFRRGGGGALTHHSIGKGATVVTIWAGAETKEAVESALSVVRATLPGFDLEAKTEYLRHSPYIFAPAGIGALAAGTAITGHLAQFAAMLGGLITGDDFTAPSLTVPGVVLGVVGVLATVAMFFGVVPTFFHRAVKALDQGTLPTPQRRATPPAKPRKATTRKDNEGNVYEVAAKDGDYPLHKSAFKMGATLLAAFIAPQAGAASGTNQTAVRATPPDMIERIGPVLGAADDGATVHLSSVGIDSSVALIGAPGSGKSSTVRHLAAWYMLERTRPSNLPNFPGQHNSLVVFVPKADDAAKMQAWAGALGERLHTVELGNPTGLAINMFGVPGTIAQKAEHVVDAMVYAFGESSIGFESQRTLKWVLTAAQVVDDEVAKTAGLEPGRSTIYYASVLLATYGDQQAVALAKAIDSAASTAENEVTRAEREGQDTTALRERMTRLKMATAELQPMFGPTVTNSQRAGFQKAPGNKVHLLMSLDHWWAPQRKAASWDSVLTKHRAVQILTGTTAQGHHVGAEIEKALSSMLMFTLQRAIERLCSGWAESNRWVTIVADELSDLAGASPEVLSWLRDRGRSYGVRLVFATQRPDQLPQEVKTAFMSFSTLIAFKQDTGPVAKAIADDLSADGSDWSGADVLNLPEHHAVVRANVRFNRQPAFVVKPLYAENQMQNFASMQGY